MTSLETTHLSVRFYGHVQGVGFRFYAMQLARGYAVAGYVRNQPDGSVLLELEGDAAELDRYLTELQGRMDAFIRRMEVARAQRSPQYQGFRLG